MDDNLGKQIGDACASQFIDVENETVEVANAHLMAAAPELLEALKYARRMVKASECDVSFIDAAIAKAIGEQA